MDAAGQRRDRPLDTLRRVEDMLGDVNRETVRLEGMIRDVRSALFDGHKQILEQALGIRNELAALRGDVREMRVEARGEWPVPAELPPRPIPPDYGESAE